MRRAASIIACVAACSAPGVDVQIHVDGAKRVEVFIATQHCEQTDGTPCPAGIGWDPSVTLPPSGKIYLLADDQRFEATAKDGYFDVQLQAEPGHEHPLALAIVGFDGAGAPVAAAVLRDVEIPAADTQIWSVTLDPVALAAEDVKQPPVSPFDARVRTWRSADESQSSCLAYQHWDSTAWVTEYFVPPGDRDCDAEPNDCQPYWAKLAAGTGVACLTTAGPDVTGTCTLGASSCSSAGACTQGTPDGNLCMPDAICQQCAGKPVGECVGAHLDDPALPFSATQGSCTFLKTSTWCATAGRLQFSGSSRCTGASLRTGAAPFAGGVSSDIFTYVTIKVSPLSTTPCEIEVAITASSLNFSGYEEVAILAVDFENGRQIVLPLRLVFDSALDCTLQEPCGFSASDDLVFACAGP